MPADERPTDTPPAHDAPARSGRLRRALIVVPAAALFTVLGVALFQESPEAELGYPAPSLSEPSLADPERTISLDDHRGRPVVLNFWASWCEPCRQEAPEFARAAERYADDVDFLGVNILDGREEALAYVDEYGIPYPSVRDATGDAAERFNVTGVPETFFIDASGAVVGKQAGAFTEGSLVELIERFLALDEGEVMGTTGSGASRPVP